ncbi:hypothetical protein A6U87_03210 [Rhizobium sp. AC44/96]|uniref:DUF6790 family protein n=1 Tax=Rhizobium sp. AC44/96 TaxID=1841654 RepID=UPI00080FBED8|nr:DUF6790 family protein [Rhizobium sp. AC44/96]OCJ17944.1 hypothetical protein A6U87_03210 [Rhizobium sp. AC44/96]
MYLAILLLLMLVLPVISIIAEATTANGDLVFLIGKWFVFWAVGLRLLLAGVRQVTKPSFTAETIFGVTDTKAFPLVQEIGFGNLSIGLLAMASILVREWITPAALVGCLFFGLAGVKHLLNPQRSRTENIPMISDLWIAAVLAVFLIATAAGFQVPIT